MEIADRSGVARGFGKGRAAEQMRHVGFLGGENNLCDAVTVDT